jgi:hypothetical protein
MKTTFLKKYKASKKWQNRCRIVALYHHTMRMKHKHWGIRATGKYFGISHGLVADNVALTEHFDEIKHCITRQAALLALGRYKKEW